LAAKTAITTESLAAEAEEARLAAMANGQISAAVSAIKEKGVLTGKRIERSEVGGPSEFETMTDEELERALIERMARLGFTVTRQDVGETQNDVGSLRLSGIPHSLLRYPSLTQKWPLVSSASIRLGV
jgi:hypothetical protein